MGLKREVQHRELDVYKIMGGGSKWQLERQEAGGFHGNC